MMKKKIMILGAGGYQLPLIKKAKNMGLTTVVVSPKGKYPGIALADIWLDIDTTDIDRIVKSAREHGVSGVSTTGTDVCVPSLGKVVDDLGLSGTGYEASKRCLDKVLMKKAFMKHNVSTAAFQVFTDIVEAEMFASMLGYPVMVKAPDSSGSRGITKVNSADEFHFAWDRAHLVSRSKEIIVEQFLKGVEFGAQAFVHGNKVIAVLPHRDTVTPAPYYTPIGHSMPTDLTENQQAKTVKVIEQAVQALRIRDCVSNVDLILVDGDPKVIEIGARMGATCLPENISIYTGQDIYEHVIRLSMGEHPDLNVTAKQANASLLLRSEKTGIVTSLTVPEDLLNHPDLIDFHLDISVGDSIRAFNVGPDRIGHVIVKADSAEMGERLAEEMVSKVHIRVAG